MSTKHRVESWRVHKHGRRTNYLSTQRTLVFSFHKKIAKICDYVGQSTVRKGPLTQRWRHTCHVCLRRRRGNVNTEFGYLRVINARFRVTGTFSDSVDTGAHLSLFSKHFFQKRQLYRPSSNNHPQPPNTISVKPPTLSAYVDTLLI